MLHLVLSRVGGGKTTYCMNLIRDLCKNQNNKITLIVPEQFGFTSQKNVLELVGAKGMAQVDVTTFTELGEELITVPAVHAKKRLDDSSASVIMANALEETKNELTLYGRHTGRASVISEFISLSKEFKQNSLMPSSVKMIAENMEASLLKSKLSDISRVLGEYDRQVSESFFNPSDLLSELVKTKALDEYFENRIVFIDSFTGFTKAEYEVIRRIVMKSAVCYVALCTDNDEDEFDSTDLFAPTMKTAKELKEIAKECGIVKAKTEYLSAYPKYNNFPPKFNHYRAKELDSLEKMLYSSSATQYEEECPAITLCKAQDIYSECEYVAATVKKLVREENYRYRNIAVIARNIEDYKQPLVSALKKYDINVFEDTRKSVASSPVINLTATVTEIAAKGFTNENILRLLKTNLTGLTVEEISELENYAYLWQIKGRKWLDDWTASPSGYGKKSEEDEEKLAQLNELRKRTVEPVLHLKNKLKGGVDGTEALTALWNYLVEINASENLKANALRLNKNGQSGAVAELERMWDFLMEILDKAETLLRGKTVTATKLYETLSLMLSVETAGVIPQGIDEITIGSADRIRISSPKAVFIVGANEGVFPSDSVKASALTDKERIQMDKLGIHLNDTGEWRLAQERLIAYCSVCCAREKLFVSYSKRSISGEELNPGDFYLRIKSLFTKCREYDTAGLDPVYYSQGKQTAFEQLAKSQSSVFRKTVTEFFRNDSEYSGKLVALQRAAGGRSFSIIDRSISEALFGKNMYLSASRVEQYYKCAFSYFCKYGLNILPRKPAALDQTQRGNIIHSTMEYLLKVHTHEELLSFDENKLFSIISAYMDECLEELLNGEEQTERFKSTYLKLKHTVTQVALRLIDELSQSTFIPVDFELKIDYASEIKPYTLTTGDGSISVFGAVDRVDTAEIDGIKYFRIIDYKSSGKDFRLCDVMQGLNMQMLIYLFTIWHNGESKYGKGITPAGVLYYNAGSPYISLKRGTSEDSIRQEKYKTLKMSGLVLQNQQVVNAMEKGGNGTFIPAKLDKDGNATGDVISLIQLKKLQERANKLLTEMASSLHSGKIEALPAYSGKTYPKVCEYCDYKAVCMYEKDIEVREIPEARNKEITDNLIQEG